MQNGGSYVEKESGRDREKRVSEMERESGRGGKGKWVRWEKKVGDVGEESE
jgi:hypothetical protein